MGLSSTLRTIVRRTGEVSRNRCTQHRPLAVQLAPKTAARSCLLPRSSPAVIACSTVSMGLETVSARVPRSSSEYCKKRSAVAHPDAEDHNSRKNAGLLTMTTVKRPKSVKNHLEKASSTYSSSVPDSPNRKSPVCTLKTLTDLNLVPARIIRGSTHTLRIRESRIRLE